MMDFSHVTNITIPEGSVSSIADSSGNILWHKGTYLWTLWDGGPVDGVTWNGNSLTRKGYYGAFYANVQSTTLRGLLYTSSYTSYYQNAHFVTTESLVIPPTATTINIKAYCASTGYGFNDDYSVKIGLIPNDSTLADDFITIGTDTCSGTLYNSLAKAKTITKDCSAYAGLTGYRPMIYFRQRPNSSNQRIVYIAKIWYE